MGNIFSTNTNKRPPEPPVRSEQSDIVVHYNTESEPRAAFDEIERDLNSLGEVLHRIQEEHAYQQVVNRSGQSSIPRKPISNQKSSSSNLNLSFKKY